MDEQKHFQGRLEGSDEVQRHRLFEQHNAPLLLGKLALPLAFLPFLFYVSSLSLFLPLHSMATLNQTYLIIYDVLENVVVLEAKLQSALEDLEWNEESRRRMEAVEASRAKKFVKIMDGNEELKGKLRDS